MYAHLHCLEEMFGIHLQLEDMSCGRLTVKMDIHQCIAVLRPYIAQIYCFLCRYQTYILALVGAA